MTTSAGLEIPHEQLSPETLRGVVEEFVTRDGTNLAEADSKIREVLALLEQGAAKLWFDERTRTCNIVVTSDTAPARPSRATR